MRPAYRLDAMEFTGHPTPRYATRRVTRRFRSTRALVRHCKTVARVIHITVEQS